MAERTNAPKRREGDRYQMTPQVIEFNYRESTGWKLCHDLHARMIVSSYAPLGTLFRHSRSLFFKDMRTICNLLDRYNL